MKLQIRLIQLLLLHISTTLAKRQVICELDPEVSQIEISRRSLLKSPSRPSPIDSNSPVKDSHKVALVYNYFDIKKDGDDGSIGLTFDPESTPRVECDRISADGEEKYTCGAFYDGHSDDISTDNINFVNLDLDKLNNQWNVTGRGLWCVSIPSPRDFQVRFVIDEKKRGIRDLIGLYGGASLLMLLVTAAVGVLKVKNQAIREVIVALTGYAVLKQLISLLVRSISNDADERVFLIVLLTLVQCGAFITQCSFIMFYRILPQMRFKQVPLNQTPASILESTSTGTENTRQCRTTVVVDPMRDSKESSVFLIIFTALLDMVLTGSALGAPIQYYALSLSMNEKNPSLFFASVICVIIALFYAIFIMSARENMLLGDPSQKKSYAMTFLALASYPFIYSAFSGVLSAITWLRSSKLILHFMEDSLTKVGICLDNLMMTWLIVVIAWNHHMESWHDGTNDEGYQGVEQGEVDDIEAHGSFADSKKQIHNDL